MTRRRNVGYWRKEFGAPGAHRADCAPYGGRKRATYNQYWGLRPLWTVPKYAHWYEEVLDTEYKVISDAKGDDE